MSGGIYEKMKDSGVAEPLFATVGVFAGWFVFFLLLPFLILSGLGLFLLALLLLIGLLNAASYGALALTGLVAVTTGVVLAVVAQVRYRRLMGEVERVELHIRHPQWFSAPENPITRENVREEVAAWMRNAVVGLVMGAILGVTGLILWLR
ncbi:MAG: hypothetical protein U0736_13525 [Gemmataceae bacterium]